MRCGTFCSRGRSSCLARASSRHSSTASISCSLSHPGVPDIEGLNAILEPRTGWQTVAVTGLVPDEIFFAMLSERVFPVGNFIRKREELDYLEEPDCFHDMFGHIPMLAHHDYAEMTRHVGELGVAAIAAGEGDRAARLYWHSVEFGLAREQGELKILGAGLASSFGESHFSLESEAVERLPFSVARAVHTPYRHDAFQPRYLVSESLEQTIAEVLASDSGAPARAIGGAWPTSRDRGRISQRARSAHAARRARLLRDRGDGRHLRRPATASRPA